MNALMYKPDWAEARARLTQWWNGGDIGRPVMIIRTPRRHPHEDIPEMPKPDGWITDYSTKSLDYRVNLALRACLNCDYLGEATPNAAVGDLGPNCLALFLGSSAVEMPDTVWFTPCIEDPQKAVFTYDSDNFYWNFCLTAYKTVAPLAKGKFYQKFPDLIEGLDTLAAMRGAERLLEDMIDRPEWVHQALRRITALYFRYYDALYEILRDEDGGSFFWCWAPGRTAKFQCDYSAMISPAMFREFMLPVLEEMCEKVDYPLYHWDGPDALRHQDALLSLDKLKMIQWQPGAGAEPAWHPRWWPMYHRNLAAGKKMLVHIAGRGREVEERLLALKKEFGSQMKGMMLTLWAPDSETAMKWLDMMTIDE
ncbi:MAG TPA: hypothetical protein GXZ82_05610 [Firmicutes bacterium]|jgi:hypothetical protein|nr:hypothetical protein [Bacillota bacterium]